MNTDSTRGQNVALMGLVLQAVLAGVFCTVWLLTGAVAAKGVFLLNAAALVVWAISVALFYCRRLADLEAEELADLAETRDGALFGAEGGPVPLAQRRLTMIQRWLAPVVALLVGLGLLAAGGWLGRPLLAAWPDPATLDAALMWAFFSLGASFSGFLYSRYALGMARTPRYRLLRAGGGFMTLSILTGALLCGGFFLEHLKIQWGLRILPYVTVALMIVLGVELIANFILDFYRPRKPDVEPRPSFDSRMANLLSEPGSVAHSIAEAMNYQFGFEVSSTWFYQLLRKTIVPLILFGVLALVGISAIVVVGPGQQGVVLTFGAADADAPVRESGLSLKWPWPIQTVDIVDTRRVRAFTIGIAEHHGNEPEQAHSDDDGHDHGRPTRQQVRVLRTGLIIWTEDHAGPGGHEEVNFLASRPRLADASDDSSGALGLIRMVFTVDYCVNNVYRFRYGVSDAALVLHGLAMREATLFAAQRDIDTLMQRGDGMAAEQIRTAIAAAADELELGVDIVGVTIRGVHPLPEVADAFEEVIKAEQEGKGSVLDARISADDLLSSVAGSKAAAIGLINALSDVQALEQQGATSEQIAAAEAKAAALLDGSGGMAKVMINQARADRWATENAERGRWTAYQSELAAFNAAPRLYTLEAKLNVLSGGLRNAQKMILGIDRSNVEIRYQDDRRVVGGGFKLDSN